MIRFSEKAEKGIRVASMVVAVVTLAALAHIFFDALMSCLLLVWKHTVDGIVVPVLRDMESEVLTWLSFGMAVMAVYGMRKRLKEVFRGKPWRWYTVLIFPLLMVGIVIYVANWGASYGVFFRSAGNMGIYYDQIFTYTGWGVLSGLSLFAVVISVFGMDRIYVEQKKAEQFQVQAAVYQMLKEQAWEKLGDYLKRMEDGAQLGISEEATGNRAMDALLCQKRKQAEEKGIDWECDVRIPKQCRVNEFDFCVLFGNLLDNALEACGRLQDKGKAQEQEVQPFIRVRAQAVKSCFLLDIKNSMDAEEKQVHGSAKKESAQGHGIGLLNVSDVANRYDGAMQTEIRNGAFAISVLLPFGETARRARFSSKKILPPRAALQTVRKQMARIPTTGQTGNQKWISSLYSIQVRGLWSSRKIRG